MRMMFRLTILLAGLVATASPSARDVQAGNDIATQLQMVSNSQSLPRFDRVLLLESTSETSANVSIGDLNGDGNLDILLVKGRHWPLISRVLLGDGKGHFPIAYNLSETPYRSYSGRLVDIEGDGDLDVVLSVTHQTQRSSTLMMGRVISTSDHPTAGLSGRLETPALPISTAMVGPISSSPIELTRTPLTISV